MYALRVSAGINRGHTSIGFTNFITVAKLLSPLQSAVAD